MGEPPFLNLQRLCAHLRLGLLQRRYDTQLLHQPQSIPNDPSLSNPSTRYAVTTILSTLISLLVGAIPARKSPLCVPLRAFPCSRVPGKSAEPTAYFLRT